MPDAGRQIWEIRSSKRCQAHHIEKIEVSKSKTKIMKKEPREMEIEKKKRMRDEGKDNEKWSFMKWSLVKINTIWTCLSFLSNPNPGLHYVL